MARQKGLIKVEGSLGDLSFYSSVFGDIVRRKGGASKEKIRKSPAFARLREHHAEFKDCAKAGKLFRQVLRTYTLQAADHTLVWRTTQLMNRLKDLDTQSDRGKRKVSKGLASNEGKALMKGFALNSKAPLKRILKRPLLVEDGEISIPKLVPKRDLLGPAGATMVRVTGICMNIDFETQKSQVQEEGLDLPLDMKSRDLVLHLETPRGKGFKIYLLQICFLQKVNGKEYALADKSGNALEVVFSF